MSSLYLANLNRYRLVMNMEENFVEFQFITGYRLFVRVQSKKSTLMSHKLTISRNCTVLTCSTLC